MCLSGGNPGQASADQAKAEADAARVKEQERQARITAGRANIDEKFKGFDDNYYNKYRDTYLATTQPQIEQQATDARKDLIYSLERAGLRNSSVAGEQASNLEQKGAEQKGAAIEKAGGAAQDLRNRVAESRSGAERDLMLTEDPTRASNDALARTESLTADKPTPGILGPLFESAALGWQAYQGGNKQMTADASAARLLNNLNSASKVG
jgi:hypothetical protein